MGIMDYLLEYYIYFVIVAGFLILAVIGYLIDSNRTKKIREELSKDKNEFEQIPIAAFGENVTLGSTLNKTYLKTQTQENASMPSAPQPEIQNPSVPPIKPNGQ